MKRTIYSKELYAYFTELLEAVDQRPKCVQLRKKRRQGTTKMSNQFCTSCKQSYTALNGCYCTLLNRYVEHTKEPPCSTSKTEKK